MQQQHQVAAMLVCLPRGKAPPAACDSSISLHPGALSVSGCPQHTKVSNATWSASHSLFFAKWNPVCISIWSSLHRLSGNVAYFHSAA